MKNLRVYNLITKQWQASDLENAPMAEFKQKCIDENSYGIVVETAIPLAECPSEIVPFGSQYEEVISPAIDIEEVKDEEGNIITEAQHHDAVTRAMIKFPAQYVMIETDTTAQVMEKKAIEDRSDERLFCLMLIDALAAYNLSNATDESINDLFYNPHGIAIVLALLTGGTRPARDLMAQHGATMYPQVVVDSFIAKLDHRLQERN